MYNFDRVLALGINIDHARELRRISMTLHRWYELECGDGSKKPTKGGRIMTHLTVQYRVRGQYGETAAKSEKLTADQMVALMVSEAKPGVYLRIMDGNGILHEDAGYSRQCNHGYRGDPDTCVDCQAGNIGKVNA